MSTSLSALLQACAREMGEEGQAAQWPVVRLATGGTTSTLIDTRLIESGGDDETYKNVWLRLVRKESGTSAGIGATSMTGSGWTIDFWNGGTVTIWEDGHLHVGTITDGTATVLTLTWAPHQPTGTLLAYELQSEYIRRVTFAADSGTFTLLGGNVATAVGAGEEYELWYLIHPEFARESINDALNEMEYTEVLPLTLVTDGDMETTNSTGWTGTNATPTKGRTLVQLGKHSLSVAASAANGYAASGAVVVTPGETLIVAAPVYGDKKQAELVLYDVTNSANIETARHDEEGWAILAFTASAPADCYEVAAWLRTKTNGGTTYWDFVGILKASQRTYPAPSWLDKDCNFLKLAYLPLGPALGSDNARNAYAMWPDWLAHLHTFGTIQAERGVVPLRLQMGQAPPSYPVLVIGKRNYPSLTLEVDTTTADKNTVVYGGLYHAFRRLGRDYQNEREYWAQKYARLRRKYEGGANIKLVSTYGA